MRAVWAIAKRELHSFYVSPIAYIVLPLFFLVTSIIHNGEFFELRETNMAIASVYNWMFFMSIFILPLFSMRIFSEEYQEGTFELLFTVPITNWTIVMGKYIGLVLTFLSLLVYSLVYPLIHIIVGDPDLGPLFSIILGFFLAGSSFLSIGLFISSLTRYQIAAAIMTILVSVFILILGGLLPDDSSLWRDFLEAVSFSTHFQSFNIGAIKLEDIFYFLSLSFVFLALTEVRLGLKRT